MVGDIQPGNVLGKDIYNRDGVMLMPSGTVLGEKAVDKLLKNDISEIYIKVKLAEAEIAAAFVEQEDRVDNSRLLSPCLKIDDVIYEKTREQAHKYVKKTMLKVGKMGKIDLKKINILIETIMEDLLTQKDIVLTLSKLRSVDDYTYEHSVNVCILSLIMGIDAGLDSTALKHLGIGAMLHDIGKIGISEDILKKPSKLTKYEYEQIKLHTDIGYNILVNNNVAEESAIIALCHHERFDGTGYNGKLKGEKINLLARITAIADTYDAMSNDRVYKRKLKPNFVYREMTKMGGNHFDEKLLTDFIKHLSMYPIGSGVILNTNHHGVVIAQNKFLPESPVIRVFRSNSEIGKVGFVDIDMATTKHIYIKDTF